VHVEAKWRDALAFAQALVEHAIGAAGGGDVADESFDLALGEACAGGEEEEERFHGVCVWN